MCKNQDYKKIKGIDDFLIFYCVHISCVKMISLLILLGFTKHLAKQTFFFFP